MYGYAGFLLDVNLTTMTLERVALNETMIRSLGGVGLSTRIVTDNVSPGIDPLGPENVLCFAVGAFVGTSMPTACRTEVSAKSPATGLFGTSNSGNYWGSELKYAGFDAVIIRGKAEHLVYIIIRNGDVEIVAAEKLQGKDSWETIQSIRDQWIDQELQIAAIGQAGENLCRFASIQNGPYDAWGRTGLGAVMGSKNLKAIAVRGTQKIKVFDKRKVQSAFEWCRQDIANSPFFAAFKEYGTMLATGPYHEFGALPGRNFQRGQLDQWLETRGRKMVHKYSKRSVACISCPIACAHWVEVQEGPYKGLELKDMEVTPVIGFGAGCDVDNIPAIAKLSEKCQQYGIDMVSAASTIGFAMELYQRGLLTAEDVGCQLDWGNVESIFHLLDAIANRKGIGNILAEGTLRAGAMIPGASYYAMHVKGLEIPMTDPRGRWSTWTFGNLTNIRGGDHLRNRNPVENLRFNSNPINYQYEKFGLGEEVFKKLDIPDEIKNTIFSDGENASIPQMSKWAEDLISVYNSVGICIRPPVLQAIGPTHIATVFSALTGVELSAKEVMLAGERTWNLQKLFNLRCGEGNGSMQSVFPERFYKEPMTQGPSCGRKLDHGKVQAVLEEYYEARGWSQSGVPSDSKLKELEIM